MKNTIYTVIVLLLAACAAPDKRAELEKLRKQKAELEEQIATLEKEAGPDTTAGEKPLQVKVQTIQPEVFKTFIEVQGVVEAEENVALSTEMPGTINRIHVKAGDRVTVGQVLAETDARAVQQQLTSAQAQLDLARQSYEKTKNLWDQKIGTEMQYLQTKTAMEAAEAGVAALQEQVRMTKIISPINGTVDNVNVRIGQAVAPGMQAIRVINFSNLKVEADVAETYMSRVKKGNRVQVIFPDLRDSVMAEVTYASRSIDPLTRTFRVEVKLDDKKEYHPNMVARVRINDFRSPEPVIVLPVKYIQKGLKESYVFVTENGRVTKRRITIGREYAGMAEVTEGLEAGEQLITGGYDLVNENDTVVTVAATETE